MIKKQLHNTCNKLNKNDIYYWVDLGVLLGLVREGEPISWDDDIDIGILSSEIGDVLDIFRNPNNEIILSKYKNNICKIKVVPKRTNSLKIDFIVYYVGEEFAWNITHKRTNSYNLLSRLHSAYHWYSHNTVIMDPIFNTINEIRTRKVPKKYYLNREFSERHNIYMPSPSSDYLEFVYGEWKVPKEDYDFWNDSGLIQNLEPEQLFDLDEVFVDNIDS